MSLTVSVAGVGKIGRRHAAILAATSGVELGPLVDVDRERARSVADELDATAGELDDALDASDALFVCTPDDEHVAITERAIEAGLHTLVEKPLATTPSDTARLRDAAAASGAVHAVGHVLRFDPRYRSVKDAMGAGDLGDVVTVSMERFVERARIRRTGAVSPPWIRLGVHDFDLLEWLVGDHVTALGAADATGALAADGYDLPETVAVLAELASGATATLTMGFCLPDGHRGSEVRTVVAGTDGTATVSAGGDETVLSNEAGTRGVDTHLWPDVAGIPDGALANQDRAVLRAFRDGTASPIPFDAGHRAVEIADAVGTAVENGDRVPVSAPDSSSG